MDEQEKILKVLQDSNEPLKSGDIAAKVELPKDQVSKMITKLKNDGKVTSPKRCYYSAS